MKTKHSAISALFIGLFLVSDLAQATDYKYVKVSCSYNVTFKDDSTKNYSASFEWALLKEEGRELIRSNIAISGRPELVRITNSVCMNTYAIKNIAFQLEQDSVNLEGVYPSAAQNADSNWKLTMRDKPEGSTFSSRCTAINITKEDMSNLEYMKGFSTFRFGVTPRKQSQIEKITGTKVSCENGNN